MSTATAIAVLVGSAALSVTAAGTASAATAASVTSPGGIAPDGPLQRVFVGDADKGIVASDYAGNLIGSVSLEGVTGVTISDDGATVYAARAAFNEIVAVDAATLAVKAHYPVATDTGPRHIAFSAGKVWFTYGDQWSGNLGSFDPAVDPASGTDPVTLGLFPAGNLGIWGQGLLDTDPSQPGVLAVGETGVSTDSMAVLDVSGAAPALTAYYQGDYSLNSGIGDIDLVPGGTQVMVNGAQLDSYAGGKFSASTTYPAGQRADIAADGLVAQANGAKVAVYKAGSVKPLRTFTNTAGVVDLAWAPDSSRVFALVSSGTKYVVKALTDPTKNVPTLTVNAPTKGIRAKKLTVTGKLSASVALPAGVKVKVTRTDFLSPSGKALADVTVTSDGTFSFTDTPPSGGIVTYKVTYAGDAAHAAVSASDKVTIPRTIPSMTLNHNGAVYTYGTDATFTAHLGTTYTNRTVALYADPFGADKPKKLLKTGKVNSAGNISVKVDMTRDTTVTAVFAADSRYAGRTVKSVAGAKVKASVAITKQYKTAKIGSTSYYWFHKKTAPIATTTMTYYKGREQRTDVQVYYQGKWYSSGSQYFALGTSGKCAVNLGAPGESGLRARVRAAYINGSSGDTVNSTTYSSWKYLYFTN
ncbi:Ig-like domain repeat protein [Streptomyces sp. NPDC008150]|uniref:Ig-like domain repeat protein n=1 Tax=Streptomyces sp. NPDC008150 TaxID=3364816 RepID=UPI0036E0ABCA